MGHINRDGYGVMGQGPGRPVPVLAHRLVWSELGGTLPENLHHVRDICPHKHCVRPLCLEPLTVTAHALLHAAEEPRAACSNGHAFTIENTYWRNGKNGRKSRQCRRCKADREAARMAAMPEDERRTLRRESARRLRSR